MEDLYLKEHATITAGCGATMLGIELPLGFWRNSITSKPEYQQDYAAYKERLIEVYRTVNPNNQNPTEHELYRFGKLIEEGDRFPYLNRDIVENKETLYQEDFYIALREHFGSYQGPSDLVQIQKEVMSQTQIVDWLDSFTALPVGVAGFFFIIGAIYLALATPAALVSRLKGSSDN